MVITGKCAKQTIIAIIVNNNELWIGTNYCNDPQLNCPRGTMKTGEGYELCKNICKQENHAEVNACIAAGEKAKGGILYLIGHYYCCNSCKTVMNNYGISKVVICAND